MAALTATITGRLMDAALAASIRTPVTVSLVTGGVPGVTGDGSIVSAVTVKPDTAGVVSVVLPLNSEVSNAAGTFYTARVGASWSWRFRLVAEHAGMSFAWGDSELTVTAPDVPMASGARGGQGVAGEAGALPPSTVAARPAAATVADGVLHFATDLNGGQAAVSDGTAWQPAAPPLATAFGGKHLGGVQFATNQTNAGKSGQTDLAGMAVTFTPTGGPVLVVVSALLTQVRRSTWTPVPGTLRAPTLLLVVDGAIVVGVAGPDVDVSILPTTGTGRSIAASLVWPIIGLSAAPHTVKLALPAQATEHTWGASLGFPAFGTPGTRLDVVQLS